MWTFNCSMVSRCLRTRVFATLVLAPFVSIQLSRYPMLLLLGSLLVASKYQWRLVRYSNNTLSTIPLSELLLHNPRQGNTTCISSS
ncbi:hypothetical protein F4823DRAFT_602855, partial [Ustulina deusta]